MGYASRAGRARVSASNPQAQAVCDRCGLWYNHIDLQYQYEWNATQLYNTQLLFCRSCLDQPQEQFRTLVLPPDPQPVLNARTEPFATDENPISGFGTSIGNLTHGGGLAAAFDAMAGKPQVFCAAITISVYGYGNTIGKQWSVATQPVSAQASTQTVNISALTIYAPSDSSILGVDTHAKSLLHFDDDFSDSGVAGLTWSLFDNPIIDTTTKKFGSGSAFFHGGGPTHDDIYTAATPSLAFGDGDFTVDCWMQAATLGIARNFCGQVNALPITPALSSFTIGLTAGALLQASVYVGSTSYTITGTTVLTTGAFHHVALVRSGGALMLFLDGVQEGSDLAISASVNASAQAFTIGAGGNNVAPIWHGWIDEFRVTVGVARWTANFTPPTAAASNTPVGIEFQGSNDGATWTTLYSASVAGLAGDVIEVTSPIAGSYQYHQLVIEGDGASTIAIAQLVLEGQLN